METGILIIAIMCIIWIVIVNIIRIYLQHDARKSGEYSYYIELRLLSYHEGKIHGEIHRHMRYTLSDRTREWEEFVLDHLGQWVRIDYDVVFRGHVFLTMSSEIKDINVIENLSPKPNHNI